MATGNIPRNSDIDSVLDDILAEHHGGSDDLFPEPDRAGPIIAPTQDNLHNHQDSVSVDDSREVARRIDLRRRSRLSRRAIDHQREARRVINAAEPTNTQRTPNVPPRLAPLANRLPRLPSPGRQMPTPLSALTDDRHQLQRDRSRDARNRSTTSQTIGALYDLHRAGRQLESESRQLRALLNEPILSDPRNNNVQRDLEREIVEEMYAQQHRKRRKTQVDTCDFDPAQLVMELESCDGGLYSDQHGDYAAANVLKDDDSVYCTKGNRCNLVLRHRGGAPFSLHEIHIRAPCSGYTAPVQEGMIFISMDTDEAFTRTAQYQIQYSPVRRSTSTHPTIDLQELDGGIPYDQAPTPLRAYPRLAEIPPDFEEQTAGPFEITMSCSDDEDTWSAPDPRRTNQRAAPDRIGHLTFEDSDSEAEVASSAQTSRQARDAGSPDVNRGYLSRGQLVQTADSLTHSSLTERSPSLMAAIDLADGATQEAVKAVGGALMVPHARFFIQSDMNRCVIRFNPPVSGRFVLLKMWSPQHRQGGNIDVQSVVIKGFSGARTFPSIIPM